VGGKFKRELLVVVDGREVAAANLNDFLFSRG